MTARRPVNRVTSKRRPAETTQRRPVRVAGREPRAARKSAPAPAPAPTSRPGNPWFRVAIMSGAAIVLAGFATAAAFRPGVDAANHAFLDSASTQEVKAAAEHALTTIYSTDAKNLDAYRAGLHEVLTGAMLAEFDKYADTTFTALAQAKVVAAAKPGPTGVTMLTDDHAELLVNLVVSATKDGQSQPSATGPILVRMQKVGGHWLAAEIPDRPVVRPPTP
ncbi:hypothetical protein D5S18_09305 [Nocardia panacis]|uniref:Mce-associated membrane protein n=1 Tax=Nocardia panacis TaxID=2340916 RepID=A0A3A4KLR9_9NOCA|nr:hypothetical protein [Nocardia panacis]RJO76498.1 hypothetical protein D5S18_09305 [Nocardia panacis]